MDELSSEQLLRQGIAAVRAGHRDEGRAILLRVIEHDERNEAAWLWLSGAVEDLEERQICLENVLAINPQNAVAQAGLQRLTEQARAAPVGQPRVPPTRGPEPEPVETSYTERVPEPEPPRPTLPAAPVEAPSSVPARAAPFPQEPTSLEIDPFGCPYCGGAVSTDEPRCNHCHRQIVLHFRKRTEGPWLGWLSLFVAMQAVVAGGQAFAMIQMLDLEQLPLWLNNHPAVMFLLGRAFLVPGGLAADLQPLLTGLIVANVVLAAVGLVLFVGVVLRSRLASYVALLVLGLVVIVAAVGGIFGLVGALPALFQAILAVACFKWLLDSGSAFEWQTRRYNADLDPDLETGMDYYDQGRQYANIGMWAKAAAHWKVATQLDTRPEFNASLARAYLKLGYQAAALAQAEKAVARAPADEKFRAFRDSLLTSNTAGHDNR